MNKWRVPDAARPSPAFLRGLCVETFRVRRNKNGAPAARGGSLAPYCNRVARETDDGNMSVLVTAQEEVDLVLQFEAPFLHNLKLKVLKRLVVLFDIDYLGIDSFVFVYQLGEALIAVSQFMDQVLELGELVINVVRQNLHGTSPPSSCRMGKPAG
jgi:hypothetical protein